METMQQLLFDEEAMRPAVRKAGKTRRDFFNYEQFTDKFKPRKTTDDCFTPPAVYDAVLRFVQRTFHTEGRPVVRPFCPGGNYKEYDYPERCVVVDNPPFSIYSQIVRHYLAYGIDFFLFAPHLTQIVARADVTYLVTAADVTYENGAVVKTSFTTNLPSPLRLWACPELKHMVEDVQRVAKPVIGKNTYPVEVVATSLLGKIIHRGVELKIRKEDCAFISNLDGLRAKGKSLFGNGFLLSERAAAERAAAERAAGSVVQLSERERRMVASLSKGTTITI